MVGWHHRLDGHVFVWMLGVGDGQGGLACCRSWGCKESDMNERLNETELFTYFVIFCYLKILVSGYFNIIILSVCEWTF